DEVEAALHDPVRADEDGRAQVEERDPLAGDVLAAPLDQELRRTRRDAYLDASPVRLLDDVDERSVVEVRVGHDQLVDIAAREDGTQRPGAPEEPPTPGVAGHGE